MEDLTATEVQDAAYRCLSSNLYNELHRDRMLEATWNSVQQAIKLRLRLTKDMLAAQLQAIKQQKGEDLAQYTARCRQL